MTIKKRPGDGFRSTDLKRTKRGDYVRNLGFAPDGKQPKFRLGYDRTEAIKRHDAIIEVWKLVQERPSILGPDRKPAWDSVRLMAAKAIARGDVPHEPCGDHEDPVAYFARLNALSQKTGIKFGADERYAKGAAETRHIAENFADRLHEATGQTLHQALRSYSDHIDKEYRDANGILTDNGKTKKDQIKTIITYLPDLDLAKLDFKGCDEIFGIFRRRPVSYRYKKPMARKSCTNYMGEMGRFFWWLHMSPDFRWKQPIDFPMIGKTPRELDDDAEQEAKDVPTWKIAELKVLYEYANPLERIFFLLGLNCSYGADQAGRLRITHLRLAATDDRPSFIRRIRRKKKTRSIHRLWKPTEQGLRWAKDRRQTNADNDFLLLNRNGRPYWRLTKGGNRAQDIPSLWNRLLDRVQKDHPEFRRLPFNSVRDTSANFIRRIAGEETASLHLAHKHQSRDENLGRYTNPARRKHVKALQILEKKLATIFDAVADPFPAEQKKVQKDGGSNLTAKQIRQIKLLNGQGYKKEKIAQLVGVSRSAVWRHTRPTGSPQGAGSRYAAATALQGDSSRLQVAEDRAFANA